MILFRLQQQSIVDAEVGEREKGHGIEGYEVNTWKKKVTRCQVSRSQAVDSKNHHVVFSDNVLAAILLCALRFTDGFIKGEVHLR